MPTPPANATTSSFHLGTYNVPSDTFTQVLDLNDGATFRIHPKSLKLAQPDKTIVETGNIRAPGASVARWQYKNRHIQVEVSLRGNSTSALLASLRALLAAVEQPPYSIRLALPGATQYSYADVVAVKHDIPSDTQQILVGAITRIHIDFECRPGLRGDRITLQNLVVNPGFEAPSGPLVSVFNDSFATANAYSVVFGGAPSVAGNVMTLAATSLVTFGSPVWGAVGQWLLRWRWQTSLVAYFYLHFVDSNNWVGVQCEGATLQLIQSVGGVQHQLANVGAALTNGTFYWIALTQFPSVTNDVPDVAATLYNDSGGSLGTQIVTTGPVPTFDAVTALSGKMAIQANNTIMQVGGAFNNVHQVSLFGPGGWVFSPTDGSTGPSSGAWDGSVAGAPTSTNANTYPNGPVSSFGAARIEYPPAGTATAWWTGSACPAAAGQVVRVSVWVKSSGLHATNGVVTLFLNENNASGTFLRQDTIASVVGSVSNAGWTQLSGSVTLGANCANVTVICQTSDLTVAGESANARVWFENAQCWNQTTTGQTSMPYCEFRFPQGPSSLVVSGLQGDMVAPALCSLGLPVSGWGPGSTITYAVGRRPVSTPGWYGVAAAHGIYKSGGAQATAVLDSGSYGGYYVKATLSSSSTFGLLAFSPTASDGVGICQLWHRFQSSQTAGNSANVQGRVFLDQKTTAWFQTTTDGSDILGTAFAPLLPTVSAQNTWTLCNAGLVAMPPFPLNPTADPTRSYISPILGITDFTNNGATGSGNWHALIPVDGSLMTGIVNNPSNGGVTVTNTLWIYLDGLGEPVSSGPLDRVSPYAATYSIESGPLANPASGGGGVGNTGTGYINVNSSADPYLTLDPTLDTGSGAAQIGVNQLVAFMATNAATISPLYCELAYSPLYLYPR